MAKYWIYVLVTETSNYEIVLLGFNRCEASFYQAYPYMVSALEWCSHVCGLKKWGNENSRLKRWRNVRRGSCLKLRVIGMCTILHASFFTSKWVHLVRECESSVYFYAQIRRNTSIHTYVELCFTWHVCHNKRHNLKSCWWLNSDMWKT